MSLCEAKVCAVGDFTSKLAASYLDHIAGIEWEDTGQQHHHTCVKLQLKKALDSANLPVTTNIGTIATSCMMSVHMCDEVLYDECAHLLW